MNKNNNVKPLNTTRSRPSSTMGQEMNPLQVTGFLVPVARRFISGFNPCIMSKSRSFSTHGYQRDERRVHLIVYYLIWCLKRGGKELRGVTSFRLRKEFREDVSKMPALWTRSYFASTAGDVITETIERYMEAQKGL
jgi:hypothetical protein